MRASKAKLSFFIALLLFTLNVGAAGENEQKVAATIFPLADIATHIAGETVRVIPILTPGANPHTFELAPRAVKQLEGARVALMIGHGLDDWLKAVGESLPELELRTVDEGIDFIDREGKDPHYWLSIANAKVIAKNIAHILTERDAARRDEYQMNLDRYLTQLEETNRKIREMFLELPTRNIITFHDGWRYFARDYGLEIVGTVERSQASEPTPKQLARLAEAIRGHEIKVLFSEPGVSRAAAESLAHDFHLRLYELDPMGGVGPNQDYLELMVANARVIRKALEL